MATAQVWSGVAIAMQSAIAASKTITGITAATPPVVTSTAHGYANGTYVLIEAVAGMTQVNNRVFRVANQAANTFELESVVGAGFTAYASGGTAKAITFGTSLGTVKGLTGSGGEAKKIDTTTVHDTADQQVFGNTSPLEYQFENVWDTADAGLIAMQTASTLKAERAFKFTFASGQIMACNGTVSASGAPVGSAQDLVTTPSNISMKGTPTYYTS